VYSSSPCTGPGRAGFETSEEAAVRGAQPPSKIRRRISGLILTHISPASFRSIGFATEESRGVRKRRESCNVPRVSMHEKRLASSERSRCGARRARVQYRRSMRAPA
jgi:hypothetical protein